VDYSNLKNQDESQGYPSQNQQAENEYNYGQDESFNQSSNFGQPQDSYPDYNAGKNQSDSSQNQYSSQSQTSGGYDNYEGNSYGNGQIGNNPYDSKFLIFIFRPVFRLFRH